MNKSGRQRRFRPGIEDLDARELPSSFGGHLARTPAWVNENLIQSLAATLYAPITTTTPIQVGGTVFPPGTYSVPQPTRAEVARQTFWAQLVGHYSVGPPRFSNQAATIHIYSDGKSVASSQFNKGRAQVLLFPPADPTAKPTTEDPVAGQVNGLVSVFTSNVLQSGSVLFAEAMNLPGVASNDPTALDHGLPSHLAFMIDPAGVSGGLYSVPQFATTPATIVNPATGKPLTLQGGAGGAVAFNQGAGVLDIKYLPDSHPKAGTSQSGKVIVRLLGLNNLTGVLNPLYKAIN